MESSFGGPIIEGDLNWKAKGLYLRIKALETLISKQLAVQIEINRDGVARSMNGRVYYQWWLLYFSERSEIAFSRSRICKTVSCTRGPAESLKICRCSIVLKSFIRLRKAFILVMSVYIIGIERSFCQTKMHLRVGIGIIIFMNDIC